MENFLKHYGILGMKWGVRRYQNKDGTRTPKGKKREARERNMSEEELIKENRRMNLERQHANLTRERAGDSNLDAAKKILDASGQLTNQAKNALGANRKVEKEQMDLRKMSDNELRERINRFNLERQYTDIFGEPKKLSRGKQRALDALDIGGGLLAAGSSAVAIALAIKALKGG